MRNHKHLAAGAARTAGLILLAGAPALAAAHPGHANDPSGGFGHGFSHPFLGLDHLLAMVAVGLWAMQAGGRGIWLLPAAFLALMGAGVALGAANLHLPLIGHGIVASVFVLGLLIALAAQLPVAVCMALAGAFALFHGNSHGIGMPGAISGAAYTAGILMATALLHGAGILAGFAIQKFLAEPKIIRGIGGAVSAAAVFMWMI